MLLWPNCSQVSPHFLLILLASLVSPFHVFFPFFFRRVVKKEGKTKGEPFLNCPKPVGSQCEFFEWINYVPNSNLKKKRWVQQRVEPKAEWKRKQVQTSRQKKHTKQKVHCSQADKQLLGCSAWTEIKHNFCICMMYTTCVYTSVCFCMCTYNIYKCCINMIVIYMSTLSNYCRRYTTHSVSFRGGETCLSSLEKYLPPLS